MERKALALILFICLSAAFAETGPPAPPVAGAETGTVYKVITQNAYVYESEVITNTDHSTTWIKHATVTNTVNAYAPMLVIDVMSKDTMTGEWERDGRQFVALLGTNSAKFYTAELSIQ